MGNTGSTTYGDDIDINIELILTYVGTFLLLVLCQSTRYFERPYNHIYLEQYFLYLTIPAGLLHAVSMNDPSHSHVHGSIDLHNLI